MEDRSVHREKLDTITVSDDTGNYRDFTVEALFDMDGQSYALLSDNGETVLMRIEQNGETQELVGITNPEVIDSIMDAYEIAVDTDEVE
jgi:hypothetical protein